AEFAGLSLIMGITLRDLVGAADATYVRPFVYSTIWTLYLLNSRRVAHTYEKSPVPEGIAEVFQ
ncbi:MAG TPA: hypothetical protein VLK25_02410, partial [Allosphingosinicella sp.]|nr:hypothetical protein [Allosphingosinicella sp.]